MEASSTPPNAWMASCQLGELLTVARLPPQEVEHPRPPAATRWHPPGAVRLRPLAAERWQPLAQAPWRVRWQPLAKARWGECWQPLAGARWRLPEATRQRQLALKWVGERNPSRAPAELCDAAQEL